MKNGMYIQHICGDCLMSIVNGDDEREKNEVNKMYNTLNEWAKDDYFPLGLTSDSEPSFSHYKCDLCDQLAGDRFEYHFGSRK